MNHSGFKSSALFSHSLLKSVGVLYVSVMLIGVSCIAQEKTLTLEQCLATAHAKEHSLVVQMAKIEALESQLNLQQYEKKFQFKVLGRGDYLNETTGIETGNSEFSIGKVGVGFAASKVLYDGNGFNQEIDFQQLKLEEAKIDLTNLTKKVHRDVVEVFWGIFESELRIRTLRLEHEKTKIKEERADALFESGQNYRTDFLEQRFEKLNIEHDLIQEKANKNALIHRLSRLMGGRLIESGTLLTAEVAKFCDDSLRMILNAHPYISDSVAEKSWANPSAQRNNDWRIFFDAQTGFNIAKDFLTDESIVSGGNALFGLRIEFPVFNREQRLNQTRFIRAVYSSVLSKIESQESENHLNWNQSIRDLQLNQRSLSLIERQKKILKAQSAYLGKMQSKGDKSETDLALQDQERKKIELDFQMKLLESNRLTLCLYQNLFEEFKWKDWTKFVEENSENTFMLKTRL